MAAMRSVPRGTEVGLFEPGPPLSTGNARNCFSRYSESAAYRLLCETVSQKRSDLSHFLFIQDGDRTFGPAIATAVPHHVIAVFLSGCPAKVIGAIVGGIAITMSRIVERRRAWAIESLADELVDKKCPVSSSQSNTEISLFVWCLIGAEDASLKGRGIRNAVFVFDDDPRQASDASEAAGLISRVVRDRSPLFLLGIEVEYHLVSHDALLKRLGQVPARGSNLASVPHSIAREGDAL